MGVPISNYTVLKYLADGIENNQDNRHSFEMEYALEALENYSVFAFIIHDPLEHKDFHEFFGKQFQSLHDSTGKNLVFLGLVDSPHKHYLVGENPFYNDLRDGIDLYEAEQGQKEDQSYSAFAIANSLNIPPDQLPAIIVTHDTRLKNFRLYKTCPEKIEIQFSRLTGVAKQMKRYKQNEKLSLKEKQDILYELLNEQELDLCKGSGTANLNNSIARALSDLLSFLIEEEKEKDRRNIQVIKIARQQQRFTLLKTEKVLESLKSKLKQIDIDEVEDHLMYPLIEELSLKLATYLALLNKRNGNGATLSIPIKDEWLEQHSYHLLKTGLDVEAFLNNRQNSLDYSPSAICLGKMYEQEINYSFVHWVRKQHSIDLPKYYNQVQPGVSAKVMVKFPSQRSENLQPVDVNYGKYGSWQPPELGKTKNIARYNVTADDWKKLVSIIQKHFY